jgi:hypothetical protein
MKQAGSFATQRGAWARMLFSSVPLLIREQGLPSLSAKGTKAFQAHARSLCNGKLCQLD